MEYIATFYTHLGAIKYHRYLYNIGVSAETIPVPRKYSSNCGIGVKFSTLEDIRTLISEDIEKIYLLNDGTGKLIYNNETV
jgi:hypothetical protein